MTARENTNSVAFDQDGIDGGSNRPRRNGHPSRVDTLSFSTPTLSARRSSSFATDSSLDEVRTSMRSSTEDLLRPRATGKDDDFHQDPTIWHSLPLLFAIVPAIGGVAFQSGSIFVTDLSLLILAAIYLNWCLTLPWVWYHTAQTVKVSKPVTLNTIAEESDEEEDTRDHSSESRVSGDQASTASKQERVMTSGARKAALGELRIHEVLALVSCVAGPLAGAYILHTIRSQVSHFGDELISNLNLTLFVLCAEIRPLRHFLKMAQARTLHLQRIVREDPHAGEKIDWALVQGLSKRLNEVESTLTSYTAKTTSGTELATELSTSGIADAAKKVQASLQPQIDALNRAVRRYEKRATASMNQTEARLQDLDKRLKDTLSLAAAAATYSQTPSTLSVILDALVSLLMLPLRAVWAAVLYPVALANGVLITLLTRLGFLRHGSRNSMSSKNVSYARLGRDSPVLRISKK